MKDKPPAYSLAAAFLPLPVVDWIDSMAASSGLTPSEIIRAILHESAANSSPE